MASWMPEDSDVTGSRNGLFEQFQTFADELRGDDGRPRDIAARPRIAHARTELFGVGAARGEAGPRLFAGDRRIARLRRR